MKKNSIETWLDSVNGYFEWTNKEKEIFIKGVKIFSGLSPLKTKEITEQICAYIDENAIFEYSPKS